MPLVPAPPDRAPEEAAAAQSAPEEPAGPEAEPAASVDLEQTVRLDKGSATPSVGEPSDGEASDGKAPADEPSAGEDAAEEAVPAPARARRKVSSAGIVIAVLVGLLGFALIVQVRGTSTDSTLASARTDDLVRILSDLDSSEDRLRQEIEDLEQLKRELTAGSESADAARKAAEERADELGILAGTLPAKGPGLVVRFSGPIRASRMLDAVEELRNAGAEAMQVTGANGQSVRIIVSTWFQDADGGLNVSGAKLTGPYTITVIGDPATMKTALNIPGGVVATVSSDGGNVIVEDPGTVTVTVLAAEPNLQYAQPAS
ncbi:MAG: DUF881 domain-containing protein [Hamadaea sp.]|nr:DUF881 domain-containing protein [Hamadaea sp.]